MVKNFTPRYFSWNFEIISEPSIGVFNFRFFNRNLTEENLDEINLMISKKINEEGFSHITTTNLNGHTVLRMCFINPKTKLSDIDRTIKSLFLFSKGV